MDVLIYNNIVGIVICLGELDWIIDFLDSYWFKFDVCLRVVVYVLNKVCIVYMWKIYDEVLYLLVFIKDCDFIY